MSVSGNPATRQWAQKIARNHATATQKAQQVLQYFQNQAFSYTLSPPALSHNAIDAFLFETRRGYCEHFAAAMAFMMRAMNVPARIVGGYLGGEFNPYGNYIIVRQSDAHVWVEIWQPGHGWIRFDPTAVVQPDRLTQALTDVLTSGQPRMFDLKAWIHRLRLGWDTISSRWEAWFSGYAYRQQQALLAWLGISMSGLTGTLKALLLMLGGVVGVLTVVLLFHFRGLRAKPNRIQAAYQRFCNRLQHAGLSARRPSMGPHDYARLAAAQRPDLKNEIDAISTLYVRLRYQAKPDSTTSKLFEKQVNAFKPQPLNPTKARDHA